MHLQKINGHHPMKHYIALKIFMDQPDCEIAALCDVYEPYIMRDRSKVDPRYIKDMPGQIPKMDAVFPSKVERYSDYHKLLENKSIDAVCIATPDHWHAIMTIDAIKAGKDVYIEKPLSKTIHEGRAMVNAGKNSNRIVTVGLNRRSAPSFQKLAMRPNHQHYNLLTVLLLQEGQTMFDAVVDTLEEDDCAFFVVLGV